MNRSPNNMQQRRGRTLSMSTGIPMLDIANSLAFTPPALKPVTQSNPVPIAGNRGRRRYSRYSLSETSSSPESPKSRPCRGSPVTNALFYAAAKFNDSPSASSLPRPPSHWVLGSQTVLGSGNAIEVLA